MTAPNRKTVIRVHDAGVYYWMRKGFLKRERFWAISNITFDLYAGEVLGIIGRNGAGKSTLLRLLTGVMQPDSGSIELFDVKASLLTLQPGFVQHLSGRDNIMLGGMFLGESRAAIAKRVDAIIEFAELGRFIDQPIFTYSTGMRARLGFSLVFNLDPDVILIDEVMGVGDAYFRKKSASTMKEKIRSGKTVVIVSHDPKTMQDLCDRVIWIEEGRVHEAGDPKEILRNYKAFLREKPFRLPMREEVDYSS